MLFIFLAHQHQFFHLIALYKADTTFFAQFSFTTGSVIAKTVPKAISFHQLNNVIQKIVNFRL